MTIIEFPRKPQADDFYGSVDHSAAVIGGTLLATGALMVIAGALFAVGVAIVGGRAIANGFLILSDVAAHLPR